MATRRLIEAAFPLKEASAASLHEKNMRHGHISTLHLWPARRPLAASRAAIAAALLPDPGNDAERAALVQRLGGTLKPKRKARTEDGSTVEAEKVTGEGGILWWGHESGLDLAWFRQRILEANGGRPPRVLDPFAGGGAIPLEAMRLGCEVVANDLNPVAWFILRCTLEYPQKLAGERRPLPPFVLRDAAFMEAFLKAQGMKPGPRLRDAVARAAAEAGGAAPAQGSLEGGGAPWMRADLGWHVRAWGQWVLARVRRELADRYPTYAEWTARDPAAAVEARPLERLVPDTEGRCSADALNRDLSPTALANPRTPRWVEKPTVAYLWARTVRCKACRATVPLLKTRWLCRRDGKRVRLVMQPNQARDGVEFTVEADVPVQGNSAVAKKAADKALGGGTMSRTGVACPCCSSVMTMDDIRYEGLEHRIGAVMTAVIVDGSNGKEYRRPTPDELAAAEVPEADLSDAFADVPFGKPVEPTPKGGGGAARAFSVGGYGMVRWADLFTSRQLLAMAAFTRAVRLVKAAAIKAGHSELWGEALWAYLALASDRTADYGSAVCSWHNSKEQLRNTFGRFALPIVWDFTETNPLSGLTGDFSGAVDWISRVVTRSINDDIDGSACGITWTSAKRIEGEFDAVVTDPPYYDAIPYSDLMDFFYVWLRRSLHGFSSEVDTAFATPLGPKWDHDADDGELIDDSSRFKGDKAKSKQNFEDGMAAVFKRCADALSLDGILVIVFANKSPDAWETLVGALIRAGFVVDGSLPIQTEMGSRTRAMNSAALSSSVWLVCRKRPLTAKPGFSGRVLEGMRDNIRAQMHRFWDANIRGPDFVWAATGPALEAYSRHPVVFRESSASGAKERMPVAEFLREVRRLVVEFAVGRVLKRSEVASGEDTAGLDEVTTYYVLHRDTFGMKSAPVGACILYALSCGVSDGELADRYEVLARSGGVAAPGADEGTDGEAGEEDGADEEDAQDDPAGAEPAAEGSGSTLRLRRWDERRRRTLGLEGQGGRPAPLIDRVHRAMQLWRDGDVAKVNAFLDATGAARDPLFGQLVQAVIELARLEGKADEAALLESISNHLQTRLGIQAPAQAQFSL